MYGKAFDVDDKVLDKDFVLPIGKAKIQREGRIIPFLCTAHSIILLGKHVTVISYSRRVGNCLEVAEQLAKDGIEVEVG